MAAAPGHVVGTSPLPPVAAWALAAVLFGSPVVWVLAGPGRRRVAAGLVAGAAGAATVLVWVLSPGAPARPFASLSLAVGGDAQHLTDPVTVRVCGWTAEGTPTDVVGADRLVNLSVDGRVVAERGGTTTLTVVVIPGRHDLRAEVVTADHRAYSPALATVVEIAVAGPGRIAAAPSCGDAAPR